MIIPAEFFARDTRAVARDLLGKYLVRFDGKHWYRGIIWETEAYHGTQDLGCHCARGLTPRTRVMYGEPGHIYVYLIYGMYDMLNMVTMPQGFPAAVLIRALKNPQIGTDGRNFEDWPRDTSGPGKLTKRLGISRELNGLPLRRQTGLWVEESGIRPQKIIATPRIGIDYAGPWKDKPWRFVIEKL